MADLLEVGHVTKPHGIRGEVIVRLLTDRTERVAPGTVLASPRGPMTVVASRRHQSDWIVAFEGVIDRNGAEALRGLTLSAAPIEDAEAVFVHELIGRRLVTSDGVDRGEILSVQENPASDLLVLDDGSLVPLNFVTAYEPDRLVADVPDGLFDLG